MLHAETLERYRKMSRNEKMAITIQMMRENGVRFWSAPPEVIAKRLKIIRQQNDDRNRRYLEAFARLKEKEEQSSTLDTQSPLIS